MAVQLWSNDCQKDKIRRTFGMLNHTENFMTKNYVSFSWPTTTLRHFVQRSGIQLKQVQWRKQFWTLLKRKYFSAVEWNLLPNIYLTGYLSDQWKAKRLRIFNRPQQKQPNSIDYYYMSPRAITAMVWLVELLAWNFGFNSLSQQT